MHHPPQIEEALRALEKWQARQHQPHTMKRSSGIDTPVLERTFALLHTYHAFLRDENAIPPARTSVQEVIVELERWIHQRRHLRLGVAQLERAQRVFRAFLDLLPDTDPPPLPQRSVPQPKKPSRKQAPRDLSQMSLFPRG